MSIWMRSIIVFLLIGAVSNTLTAFISGVMADQLADLELIESDPIPWVNTRRGGPWMNWLVLEYRHFGATQFVGHSGTWCWGPPPRDGFDPPSYLRVDDEFRSCITTGFPMRSFIGQHRFRNIPGVSPWDDAQLEPVNVLEFEIPTPSSPTTSSRIMSLPTHPLWAGFAVNSIVHGSLLLGLIRGPGTVRRLLRSRRGRCPACAYDLNHDLPSGCPECGWQRDPCSGLADS